MTTNNIDVSTRSFINVYENSILEIHNSVIENWFSLELGGFLRAGYRNALVQINNTLIRNNAAVEGGVSFP